MLVRLHHRGRVQAGNTVQTSQVGSSRPLTPVDENLVCLEAPCGPVVQTYPYTFAVDKRSVAHQESHALRVVRAPAVVHAEGLDDASLPLPDETQVHVHGPCVDAVTVAAAQDVGHPGADAGCC